jgi:DNA-binding NarL/FixJ family response regulator
MHIARVQGQIASAEQRHDEAAARLRTAADLARELRLPLQYGLAELRLAETLHQARQTKAAAAALAAAVREFEAIDARAYAQQARDFGERAHLAAAGSDDPFAVLTPRQRPVAELAAATGRPNSWIAQELFLSLKTVEAHLTHIYDTLGVRNRAELRDLYRARGGTMKEG